MVMRTMFESLSRMGRLHPASKPERHGVEVLRNIPYRAGGSHDHTLDVYRPIGATDSPVVFYIHGGAFQILSKDTHWLMGLAFASRGYTVFNINYRLAPQHPYPAGLQDAKDALLWVLEHAQSYGGDLSTLILAGESAGANLATSLTLAACYEETEPWAKAVWDANPSITAVLPACGIFQVSDTKRYRKNKKIPRWILDRIEHIQGAYLPDSLTPRALSQEEITARWPLADPLLFLERAQAPARPLPPFFIPIGTRDPILDDSRRLHAALETLGVATQIKYYPGGLHAFHALYWQPRARECWKDKFAFLDALHAP